MINLLLAVILHFRPLHVVTTDQHSCGAAGRFMRERLTITVGKDTWVHNVKWRRWDDSLLTYAASWDAYMSMAIMYTNEDAYLTITGIDEKRRPCRDTVYLTRSKR